jgi:hypothetical protein
MKSKSLWHRHRFPAGVINCAELRYLRRPRVIHTRYSVFQVLKLVATLADK